MRRLVLFAVAVVLLLGRGGARAGDEIPAGDPVRIDLSGFVPGPAVAAAKRLWAPTDPAFADAWRTGNIGEDAAVMAFQEPPHADQVLAPEILEDLVRRMVPEATGAGWASKATPRGLDVWAAPAAAAKAEKAVQWLQGALAPRLVIAATLVARDGPAAPLLVAAGSVTLLPRRWTAVWTRVGVRRFAAGYDVQIAQEAVANSPIVAALPEGEELYLRWTPGETVSVVEVFSGEVVQLPPAPIDLAGVRNVPEANVQGRVEMPRTSVRRLLTAIAAPAGQPSSAVVAWEGPNGGRTLKLTVGAAPATAPDVEVAAGRLGAVRAGASASALEDGTREGALEEAIARFQSTGAATGASTRSLEAHEQSFLLCEGPAAEVERLRSATRRAEAGLVPLVVEVRAVTVAEGALLREIDAGRAAVGRTLGKEAVGALLDGRGTVLGSVTFPVVAGVRANARVGTSVVGFYGGNVEVAQSAGAVLLAVGAWFDGLTLQATAGLTGTGDARLRVTGTRAWVRPQATTLELAFRPPVGMSSNTARAGPLDEPDARRVPVPLASNGESAVDATVLWPAAELAEGRPALLAVVGQHPRAQPDAGSDPVVLVATLRR